MAIATERDEPAERNRLELDLRNATEDIFAFNQRLLDTIQVLGDDLDNAEERATTAEDEVTGLESDVANLEAEVERLKTGIKTLAKLEVAG